MTRVEKHSSQTFNIDTRESTFLYRVSSKFQGNIILLLKMSVARC